jgi:hypothetical protein
LIPTDKSHNHPNRRAARALLACGAALYLCAILFWFSGERKNPVRDITIPIALLAGIGFFCSNPRFAQPIANWLDRWRAPSIAGRRGMTILIAILASAYLGLTALRQHRDFSMRVQDEMMYLVQVQALASGHLYLPAHPMADFFQTFYLFTRPVYSSMYFPGAALMFVPAVWLHLPWWALPLLICGGVAGMTYRVVTELTDGVYGLLAAMLVVAVPTVRTLSLQVLSYMPMALLGLMLLWAYLHFRHAKSLRWAAVIGLLAGWCAITRPLDAICFALPIGIAMLLDLKRKSPQPGNQFPSEQASIDPLPPPNGPEARSTIVRSIAVIFVAVICAVPFLSTQLLLNHAVTGRWLQTPVQKYEELYWPGVVFGLHPHVEPGEHPLATSLPQFKDDYEQFVLSHFNGKARVKPRPLAQTLEWTLPHALLLVLLPIGLLGLRDRRRGVMWAILALFPLAYFVWVMFLPYYAAVVVPITAFAVVLGAQQWVEHFPRYRVQLSAWLTLSIFLLALLALPEFRGKDKTTSSAAMQTFSKLSATIQRPAVVFFRYPTGDPMAWKHEQTYNIDAAAIDDQPIIRAQDLGERNIELIRYYAARQPARKFYRFDQQTKTLSPLAVHP